MVWLVVYSPASPGRELIMNDDSGVWHITDHLACIKQWKRYCCHVLWLASVAFKTCWGINDYSTQIRTSVFCHFEKILNFFQNVPDCIRFGVVVIVWGQAPNTHRTWKQSRVLKSTGDFVDKNHFGPGVDLVSNNWFKGFDHFIHII